MKKALIILSILLISLVLLLSFFYVYNIFFVPGGYKKSETITPYDFLNDKNPNRWEELYLNKKGDIAYKDKIIVKDNEVVFEFFLIGKDKINYTDMISLKRKASNEIYINKKGNLKQKNKVVIKHDKIPLNDKTVFTDLELIMYFKAKGAKPRKDCDPNDYTANGFMGVGCYVYSSNSKDGIYYKGSEDSEVQKQELDEYELKNNFNEIDKQAENCIKANSENFLTMAQCNYEAIKKYDTEIKSLLKRFKELLSENEYKELVKSQKKWEEYFEQNNTYLAKTIEISPPFEPYFRCSDIKRFMLQNRARSLYGIYITHIYLLKSDIIHSNQ